MDCELGSSIMNECGGVVKCRSQGCRSADIMASGRCNNQGFSLLKVSGRWVRRSVKEWTPR